MLLYTTINKQFSSLLYELKYTRICSIECNRNLESIQAGSHTGQLVNCLVYLGVQDCYILSLFC